MTTLRGRLRRIGLGFGTLFGPRAYGFFIPHRHADEARRISYPMLEAPYREAEPAFRIRLDSLAEYSAELDAIGGAPPPEPRWEQDWFPRLDGAMAYAMVRTLRPRRIVEIGAGHSTRFLARAVRDGALGTEIVSIDPTPRALVDGLAAVRRIARPLQSALPDIVGLIGVTDILFVDSSHVLMPGTDVECVLTDLAPRLPRGAYLHVHDIFLPDGYPESWAWRGYNEQSAIAVLLLSGGWRVEFASHYAATRLADAVAASPAARLPLFPGAFESSLWLRRL